ncbi:MAG: ABC transporter ATP-binding protein [Synechococcaceae cyanobacterium]|nr:ABC transporter ATP-binding protein [Synechococcaceae cyanobacterium]
MLQLEGVTRSYRLGDTETEILHGIDLRVLRGEYTAITGPSGSGKSTLMNILGCLEKPTRGRYYFDARDLTDLGDDALTDLRNFRIGFVFQQFNLLPRLTALENVMLPMVYAGYTRAERLERGADMLHQVGLGDRLANRPTQLSGGQQQRVAIARALVNQPELLLADEPTGALDSRTGQEVLDLIERMHAAGELTVVMVTHDDAVATRCRRILRLQDGRITGDTAHPTPGGAAA